MAVPSGIARLMPSFCWPPPFGPKPAITRPRTGQRKDGAPALADEATSVAACGAGVAMRAVGAGSTAATLGDAACAGAAGWTLGAAMVGCVTFPGMTSRSPIFTKVCGAILLAPAISATDFLYSREI